MRSRVFLAGVLAMMATSAPAMSPPGSAHKASPEDLGKLIDGKTLLVSVFDAGPPTVAQLVWHWQKSVITGKALVDGAKIVDVNSLIVLQDEKVCTITSDKVKTCFVPYIDDDRFYEVRDDGQVHAVSFIFAPPAAQ